MPLTMMARPAARCSAIRGRFGRAQTAWLPLVAALAFMGGPARADAPLTPDLSRPLSLDEVVRLASERNLKMAQARELWEAARGDRTSAWAALLPNLRGSLGYGRNTQKITEAVPRGFEVDTLIVSPGDTLRYPRMTSGRVDRSITGGSWSLGLSGDVSLLSMQSLYAFRVSGQALQAASYGFQDAMQGIVLQVKQQYYAFTQSKDKARVAQESYTLRQEQQRRAESLFQLGSVAKSDVLQAQVNLSTAERVKIAAENLVEQERARLAMMLALPVDSPLDVESPSRVDETAPIPAEADLVARAERQRDRKSVV